MALVIRRLNRTYTVRKAPVILRIVVGDGQFGSSVVRLDGEEIASGAIAMLLVGDGAGLRGSKVAVATTVTDVQRNTNRTSMTYELSGGPTTDVHPVDANVDQDGGSVLYVARFTFQ